MTFLVIWVKGLYYQNHIHDPFLHCQNVHINTKISISANHTQPLTKDGRQKDNNLSIHWREQAQCFTQPDYNCLRQCSPRPGQAAMLVITADLINQLGMTRSAEPGNTITSGSHSTAAKVTVSIMLTVLTPLSSTLYGNNEKGQGLGIWILLIT